MHNPTSDRRSRQVRRDAKRRRDKALDQAERRRQRAAAGAGYLPLGAFKHEFFDHIARIARPGDRLHVACCACCGRPVHAWFERGEETAAPSATPKKSP